MNDIEHYYTEIHAKGFRHTNKFSGFDSACAHFSTKFEPYTLGWVTAQCKAIDLIGGQQTSRGWVDYTVGKTFEQDGSEPVSVMSPAWEYHKDSSFPTYKEI
tara:strand:+ start:396 stop:701 length:306 start_codon:yes stop_codon:yes gene_type:complete